MLNHHLSGFFLPEKNVNSKILVSFDFLVNQIKKSVCFLTFFTYMLKKIAEKKLTVGNFSKYFAHLLKKFAAPEKLPISGNR